MAVPSTAEGPRRIGSIARKPEVMKYAERSRMAELGNQEEV